VGVSEITGTAGQARSLDDIIEVLEASRAFDLAAVPGLHTLLDHSLQTGEVLRTLRPDDVELQIAGLVHDIGHSLEPGGDDVHGEVAASFVRPVFGPRVADLVRLHVPAKRYLVTTDPLYRRDLDQGSISSLEHQGGDMSPDEVSTFENEPLGVDAVALRRADEAGKVPGLSVPGLATWLPSLRSHNSRL